MGGRERSRGPGRRDRRCPVTTLGTMGLEEEEAKKQLGQEEAQQRPEGVQTLRESQPSDGRPCCSRSHTSTTETGKGGGRRMPLIEGLLSMRSP